jgi:hypothetical protein
MVRKGQERVVGRCWRAMGTLDDRDTFEEGKYVRPCQGLEQCQCGGIVTDTGESVWGQNDHLPQELRRSYKMDKRDLTQTVI